MMKRSLVLTAAVLALTACQGDAPATAPEVDLDRLSSAWTEKVTGHGTFLGYVEVSVSATDFEDGAKGMYHYYRESSAGIFEFQVDLQCLSVSSDGSQVVMSGPMKIQTNTEGAAFVDGQAMRMNIRTEADGSQYVRVHSVEGCASWTGASVPVQSGEYKIRQ